MKSALQNDALRRQTETLRRFNRYYILRLGLLRGRFLQSKFSITEARIFHELVQTPDITAASLRRSLSLDAGYMSRLLTSLENRGLVQRKPSQQDRRSLLLKLTASGRRIAARLDQQSSREMALLLQTLSRSNRIALTVSLNKVHQILTSSEGSAAAPPPAQVIRATPTHAADACLLLNEYYREVGVVQKDAPKAVQQFLRDRDAGFWIAYVEGGVAGCVALRPLSNLPSAGECKRLYVRAQFRRRGIAELLLHTMEAHARRISLASIYLDSKDDLKVAIALYRRRSYKLCERYNDNPQATFYFRKHLKP
jgi:DNA-binding MarR family transcriptional regulator/GNAT superfamily N-acetyltransferase